MRSNMSANRDCADTDREDREREGGRKEGSQGVRRDQIRQQVELCRD